MDKCLAKTPPMGWNSWNTFSWKIDEELIRQTADFFVSSGLRDAGYEYLVIDDCWSLRERDANGRLVADPEKFPSGMKAVADYVHERGLKFGMYSCAGTHTCAGYPGSFEHEFVDAETFASWGVDYLKYDFCYKPSVADGANLYRRMGMALRNCGRDIVFSACNWGSDDVHSWIRSSGAQLFRSTGDIQDSWESIKRLAESQMGKAAYGAPYCHNDMDMLVVGMYGQSANAWIAEKIGGCSDVEYRTHFALWSIMNSPLMIGCDIRNMSQATLDILMNRDVIAINQDPECRSFYRLNQWNNPNNVFSLVKPLSGGEYAVGMFNLGDHPGEMSLEFFDMGLPYASGYQLSFYDCYKHEPVGSFKERYCTTIEPHDSRMFRVKLVRGAGV